MSFLKRRHANRLIDQALGPDAHTEKGRTLRGDFIEGTKTPALRVVEGALLGLCALGASVAILLLPPEQPNPQQVVPVTTTTPFPRPTYPIYELLPSDDGPSVQNRLTYEPPAQPNAVTTPSPVPEATP